MEKRSARRTSTFLKAQAIYGGNEPAAVECLMTDVSATGARLQFPDGENVEALPDQFELLIGKTSERRVARVIWRSLDEIGVKFETGVR